MNGSFAEEHPTGIASAIAAAAVLLFDKFVDSVEFDSFETAIVVAGVTGAVSLFTPRFRQN